jgi:tRNA(adenine34) deaminase
MFSIFSDEYFMKKAFEEAEKAFDEGEIPVGAVIVANNQIIAKAHNQTEKLHDITAHAEMIAITAAAEYFSAKYLQDCTLYVTLEPCVMCAGALSWAQIGKIVYGAREEKRGFLNYGTSILHPKTKLIGGIMEHECADLMKRFFQNRRK